VKLLIPSWRELNNADARLIRLTEFLGGKVELLPLETGTVFSEAFFEEKVADNNFCLVMNPEVLLKLFPHGEFPGVVASYLSSRFPFLFVYNLRPEPFSASIIKTFSEGRLHSVCPIEGRDAEYTVAAESEVGGYFSGLAFGLADAAHDQVLSEGPADDRGQSLIAVDKRPLLARIHERKTEVFFVAATGPADLDTAWDGKPLIQYFSRLLPSAMVLRHVFGEQCWLANQSHATLIIDDPLLRKEYGFLNYRDVLRSMDACNFHTSIAFIPHNFRRNSRDVTRMFRERPDRYSICFHGNDHTEAEFATKDADLLNSMLEVAEERMDAYHAAAEVECDPVMVFPQGNFSSTAMKVLRARNFHAAINTSAFPRGEDATLTLADVLQPAVLNYGGFPLFLRKYVRRISAQDIAFDLFFGKPIFAVEHHSIFKDPEALADLAKRINALAPKIQWSSVRTATEGAWLQRWGQDGKIHARVYAKTSRISNDSDTVQRYVVEWPERGSPDIERVMLDGAECDYARGEDGSVRFALTLSPGESRLIEVVHENKFGVSDANTRLGWTAKAFVRRRLSELRDNHLSRNPRILSAAKYLKKRLLPSGTANAEPAE
jgi:hypothetical protein